MTDAIQHLSAGGRAFGLTIPIDRSWYKSNDTGLIAMPNWNVTSEIFNHAICIVGYDIESRFFRFWNNWGDQWGQNAHGFLPFSYMTLYGIESWTMLEGLMDLRQLTAGAGTDSCALLRNESFNTLGFKLIRFDVFHMMFKDHIAWCFTTLRDGYLDVEDFFIRPDFVTGQHCAKLLEILEREASELDVPIRFWIPHADVDSHSFNHEVVYTAIKALGLRTFKAGRRWAGAQALHL